MTDQTSARLIQFPIKQHVQTQRVNNGVMEYLYILEYDRGSEAHHVCIWATDMLNAQLHLYEIAYSGRILYPLKDRAEEQERSRTQISTTPPPLPEIPDPDMPSPDPNKPRAA